MDFEPEGDLDFNAGDDGLLKIELDAPPKVPTGFDSLVESAVDFLRRGIKEVKRRPKYSVIHFGAGIELLLKARLLHEHWSLVVARPGEVSKKDFSSGDFQSVTIHQCLDRLERVCEENLAEERKCFSALAAHRNRLVHFFHTTYAGEPDRKLLEQIAIQQLTAGAFLMRLLRHRWKSQFEGHLGAIRELERSLHGHKQYLRAKFDIIQPQLKEFEGEGGLVWPCFFCGMLSAEVTDHGPPLKTTHCLVCEASRDHIQIDCPDCAGGRVEFEVGAGTCDKCRVSFDMEFLVSEIAPNGAEAYCPECPSSRSESVIAFGDGYLCLRCGTGYDAVGTCEWCNSEVAGDMSDSYLQGCMFCDGMLGHDRD